MTTTMELADQLLRMKRYQNVRIASSDAAALQGAADRLKELERDAARIDWMERQDLDELSFHFAVDRPHGGEYGVWSCEANMFLYGTTFREAVDRAMSEAALTKMTEISQEYKLP